MPAFEVKLKDATTGEIKIARVSNFVTKNNEIVAIYNTKSKCNKSEAKAAKEELENFISLIKAWQNSETGKDYTLGAEGFKIKVSEINTDKIKLITIGPKGGKKVGFDRELEYTEMELDELYKTLKYGMKS
ncbi:MAG: hypothetical protein HYW05_01170 [Candidatus Diapherotrites archaeon]|nr:hypothetical protein [Candidatus Diapherotrites archaeon]